MDDRSRCGQLVRPDDVDEPTVVALRDCWVAVTNAGGAVGFPFPPVTTETVEPHVRELVASLRPARRRVLTAYAGGALAGWVLLTANDSPLTAHWGTVQRLQSHPDHRGRGVGTDLMRYAHTVARDELGLEHLWLAARGGMGLEQFYGRLGWVVAGAHAGALRLAPDDTRDEVFMARSLRDG